MSKEYRNEVTEKYEKTIEDLLKDAPDYVTEFYKSMHNGKREISTQVAYIRDLIEFIKYQKEMLYIFAETPLKEIPIELFYELKVSNLNEYRTQLKKVRMIGNSSAKKKFSAISAFYKFLNSNGYTDKNPMRDFEFPVVNKHRIIKLDAELSNQLLSGILSNNKYLIDNDYGGSIIDIPEHVKVKRERIVLRNYAICCLFLGSGLRVSELVGLDLSDINFRQNTINIIAKGGDEVQVFFGDDVAKALKTYIDGMPLDDSIFDKYDSKKNELLDWCKNHLLDIDLKANIKKDFPDATETFIHDIELMISSMRRQGRNSLNPQKNNKAVFLSTRGTRMSVRSVELMIKEMAKTYLPEYDDRALFSPHKLRATCATRILTQTGDIQLASTQLNHKGIAVTASFYAELQKEKQKDKIKSLNMNEW